MILTSRTFFASLLAFVAVNANPVDLSKRQAITTLTSAQINTFTPFTHFASTAYCNPSTTSNWSCGANCNANPGFIPVATGGDGSSVQFWYVGYSPSQASVIVAHQGTDTSQIQALATDANAFQENLDSTLFPGVSSPVEAHSGFANEQSKTATQVLSAVQTAISQHGASKVTIVGHSLGCAIALLDGIYLPLHITGVSFQTIGYGCPRVGNQAFADYVDSHISFTHINNKKDVVPILPGRFLGYHHASGEIHISEDNSWLSCPGQDNTSTQCIVGDVPNIFDGNTGDHAGPYNGITMGC
ncbi:Lipase [Leucoagaricus sp. SymC.cos]|nr:Lipase [Leucoagaricus sp. SymC.cos]